MKCIRYLLSLLALPAFSDVTVPSTGFSGGVVPQSKFTFTGNPLNSSTLPTALSYKIIAQGAGIDPTGTTDSTTALQALITAAQGSTGTFGVPTVISFPAGTYKTTACLNVTGSNLIIEGKGVGTVFTPTAGLFCVYGTPNSITNPLRTVNQVYLRDFDVNGASATSTGGIISFINTYDIGIENVAIGCSSNSVSNGILIAQSGGVMIRNTQVYGADTCGGGNTNTNTGILVENNSQATLINADVEGFGGTNGKGIRTAGAFVWLDIIGSHAEADYWDIYHGAASDGTFQVTVSGSVMTVTSLLSTNTNTLGLGSVISTLSGTPYIVGSAVNGASCGSACTGTGGTGTYLLSAAPGNIVSPTYETALGAGRTTVHGGNYIQGPGPTVVDIIGDHFCDYGMTIQYGGNGFTVATAALKDVVIDSQAQSTGTLIAAGSDVSGVHVRNPVRDNDGGASGALNVNSLYFVKRSVTSGSATNLFTIKGFYPGAFKLHLTCAGGGGAAGIAYEESFLIANATSASSIASTTIGQVTGAYTCTATFALNATSGGFILAVTPTETGDSTPDISGYLEFYGYDPNNANQSIIMN